MSVARALNPLTKRGKSAPRSSAGTPVVASFDVFETLLVRPVGGPDDVNRLLAQRLRALGLSTLSDDAFAELRRDAELRAASANSLDRESQFTLSEVAAELSLATSLPVSVASRFCEEEVKLEGELLRALPGAKHLVEQYRQSGSQIVFSSDMYLPSKDIFAWLLREGIACEGDRIFVSGELGVSKGTGNLFRRIMRELHVKAHHIEHVGNNRHADVRGAELAGVIPRFVNQGNLTRYEKTLAGAPGGWGGALAGTSRLVRLQSAAQENSLGAAAAGVVAPLIASYVVWLLEDARERGVDHLLFLSRDGQLPYRVAQVLAPRMGINIPMTYLYASRRTWSLAALCELNTSSLTWVLESTSFLSVRSCLARAGISPDSVSRQLEEVGFGRSSWDENLKDEEREKLEGLLLSHPKLAELFTEKSREAVGLLARYLEQEGVLAANSIGLCDLGWHGTLQQALRDTLDRACDRQSSKLFGYYVGINRSDRFTPSERNITFGFLKDAYHGPKQVGKWHTRMGFFLETFCAADHGTLIAYEERDGRVQARLDERFDGEKGAMLRGVLLRSCLQFAAALPIELYRRSALRELPLPILHNVEAFWNRPRREEAQVWGRFPVDDRKGKDGSEDAGLATPFTYGTALDVLKNGSGKDRVAWFAGAMAQSDPWVVRAVSLAFKWDQLTKRP